VALPPFCQPDPSKALLLLVVVDMELMACRDVGFALHHSGVSQRDPGGRSCWAEELLGDVQGCSKDCTGKRSDNVEVNYKVSFRVTVAGEEVVDC